MRFEEMNPTPEVVPSPDALPAISPELKDLMDAALAVIATRAENVEKLDYSLGRTLYDSFQSALFRAVHDADQLSKMRMNADAVSKVDESLPHTIMKRTWGEGQKDGLARYEQVCRQDASGRFLAAGLPQADADKLVMEIFKQ